MISRTNLVRLAAWPWPAVFLSALGLVLIGVPEALEGPTLAAVGGPGHGISVANLVAAVPLLAGVIGLLTGARHRRDHLADVVRSNPLPALVLGAILGLGSVLVALGGPSTALRYWAPGAAFVIIALFGLAALVTIAEPVADA